VLCLTLAYQQVDKSKLPATKHDSINYKNLNNQKMIK